MTAFEELENTGVINGITGKQIQQDTYFVRSHIEPGNTWMQRIESKHSQYKKNKPTDVQASGIEMNVVRGGMNTGDGWIRRSNKTED